MLTDDQARALLREAGETIEVSPDPSLFEQARRARRTRRLTALAAAAAVVAVAAGGTAIGMSNPSPSPAPAPPGPATPDVPTEPAKSRTVTVPVLEGLTEQEATARLEEFGLSASPFVGDSCEPPGTVIGVDPGTGSQVPPGSVVDLFIAGTAGRGTCEEHHEANAQDRMIVDRFVAFSQAPSDESAPFAPRVALGLGDSVRAHLLEGDTADAAAWELPGPYGQWTGPFSALEYLAGASGDLDISNDVHTRARRVCATKPSGPPPKFRDSHLISIQPDAREDASCLGWWSVDLAVNDVGQITGVFLTVGDP